MKTLKRLAGAIWSLLCWLTPHVTTDVFALKPYPQAMWVPGKDGQFPFENWDNYEVLGAVSRARPWDKPTHQVTVKGWSWFEFMFMCRQVDDVHEFKRIEPFQPSLLYRIDRSLWITRFVLHMIRRAGWSLLSHSDLKFCADLAAHDWLQAEQNRTAPGCPKQAAEEEIRHWP